MQPTHTHEWVQMMVTIVFPAGMFFVFCFLFFFTNQVLFFVIYGMNYC